MLYCLIIPFITYTKVSDRVALFLLNQKQKTSLEIIKIIKLYSVTKWKFFVIEFIVTMRKRVST